MSESPEDPDLGPDLAFSLTQRPKVEEAAAPDDADPEVRAMALVRAAARELAAAAPDGWRRLTAVFVLTVAAELAAVRYTDGESTADAQPNPAVMVPVRELRALAAGLADGPWLRMELTVEASGKVDVDYDYGDEPIPSDQIFPREAYLADLEAFPRRRLPIWLGAYLFHDGRQARPPRVAAQSAVSVRRTTDELPPLAVLWARWTTLAAVHGALDSQAGPGILPSLGWFEGAGRSGSTLYLLSGGRAVLSGGQGDSPELAAAYNDRGELPDLYAGAPYWVTNAVLNPRAADGLLSFCYWWEGGSWRHGDSPAPRDISDALPLVRTEGEFVDYLLPLLTAALPTSDTGDVPDRSAQIRSAIAILGDAAESGVVTRTAVAAVLDDVERFDVAAAYFRFDAAGLTTVSPSPLPAAEAIATVRDYILDRGLETPGYPVTELVASRVGIGWMVHVPAPEGQIMLGRAIFYVADDGVLERSSSSTPPSSYQVGFEERFHQRLAVTG
ncbi:hypothetical protein [Nocardia sp. NPDC052566]|uniref:hypothetical protein n=1 Tax=Nocardia sp. NPDC052566 TaxID=3364330 RepID=UPI0037C69096